MKRPILITILLLAAGLQVIAQQGVTLSIFVKAGNIPLEGVSVSYTCDWQANLGDWSSWNSGVTDANGQIITLEGENLHNVIVEVFNIPWALQQLYGNTAYPSQYIFNSLSQSDTIEFNLQPHMPQLNNLQPTGTLAIAPGSSVFFSADVVIDGGFLIDSVQFWHGGMLVPGSLLSGNNYQSQTAWTPGLSDFYQSHDFLVIAFSSNGMSSTASQSFYLDCNGAGCPNHLPEISWITPVNLTINQISGFVPIEINLQIADADGGILTNTASVNSTSYSLIAQGGNQYSFSFTPSYYGDYEIQIESTDNQNATSSLNRTIHVIQSNFVPLPDRVIVGYWHSWDYSEAPFLYMHEIDSTHFNVIVYSFIETQGSDGFTPVLTLNEPAYSSGGSFDAQLLKDDIQSLQALGIPVLVSIGGQNGHVVLDTEAKKDVFVQGIINIVETYGFDGLDIDFEGGSMNFGGGSLSDFSYSTIAAGNYPNLKNLIDAFIEIDDYFGEGFHLTAAPELYYVQVGLAAYTDMAGSFLPVIENLRSRLDYIHVQLYNTGTVQALDNQIYGAGNADFVVAMTDMLLKGFDVALTGIHFNGLNQNQVAIGLPACPDAAPAGGYMSPNELTKALNYLVKGIPFGGNYTLSGAVYPNLRGAMTWSVNWDASPDCATAWEFSDNVYAFFNPLISVDEHAEGGADSFSLYPNPVSSMLLANISETSEICVFSASGKFMFHEVLKPGTTSLDVSGLATGIYIIQITNEKASFSRRFIKIQE